MSRSARPKPPTVAPAADHTVFDRVLLYILMAVLCARPLISESYERLDIGFLAALHEAGGPTPATTAWLDALLLAASALVLARNGRWRRSRLVALGIVLLAAAVVVSSTAAGDKPLALRASSSLLIGVLAAVALASLLQVRRTLHLVLAALLATGCTTAVKCVVQRTSEFPDLARSWEQEEKPQLLKQGFDLDDPLIINFERRLRSFEVDGFLAHPNITGSCLMMWVLVLGGVLAGSLVRVPRPAAATEASSVTKDIDPRPIAAVAAALGGALLIVALGLTRSRGAIVAGLAGLLAMLLLGFAARWATRHARFLLALLFSGYAAIIVLTAVCGLSRGTLPHPSLAFRWYYWTAAARAYQDAPRTGLGRGNFAAAYMRHKVAESTEEVRDPHNLWVSLLVELGPLGLAGGALLSVLLLRAALRGLERPGRPDNPHDKLRLAHAAPAAAGVLLVHALFSGTPFFTPGMPLVWASEIALPWIVAFFATAWVLCSLAANPRGTVWLAAGLYAALLAALLHSLLDFALLTPGGLAVFVLCAAAASTMRPTAQQASSVWQPLRLRAVAAPLAIAAVVVAGHLLWIALPTAATAASLRSLDSALRTPPPRGGPSAIHAAAAQVIRASDADPSAARAAARAVLQLSRQAGADDRARLDDLRQALEFAQVAADRDPRDMNNYSLLGTINEELARAADRLGDPDVTRRARCEAAENWERAVKLYPTNPRTRISAGKAWFEVWQSARALEAAGRAREHFEAALSIDAARPAHEVVRLRPQERAAIVEYLRLLAPTTAPASGPMSTGPSPRYYSERKTWDTAGCHWQLAASVKPGRRTGGQAARGTRLEEPALNVFRSPQQENDPATRPRRTGGWAVRTSGRSRTLAASRSRPASRRRRPEAGIRSHLSVVARRRWSELIQY